MSLLYHLEHSHKHSFRSEYLAVNEVKNANAHTIEVTYTTSNYIVSTSHVSASF